MGRFSLLGALLERLVDAFSNVLGAHGSVWRQPWAVWTESSPAWAVWAAFGDPSGPFWSPLGTVLQLSRAVAM
eukprot:7998397-Pyramimonas_sp.AAC.1